ncbi:AsmA-like C-terminal region-containing protein [Solitalea lacus]|uniref:AsmA-like C-terminal region-containing protein n=1 Tax=Solitalea lacus TaxID=2911172 RepID=UPI001EDA3DC7|nr:AsmA-like C-terminal region-containing protein [Solitalea lacus]UKJ08802.1 membrane assembly protein AsmA [Solitalea lacus]
MLKKVFITLAILIAVLLGVALCVPLLFKDKIVSTVKTSVNESVNAKIDFKEIDLTLISSFPNLGIELQDLTVIGVDSFATDTLANIKELQIDVNLMSVINGGTYEIRSISLDNPSIYAKKLKSGKTNWDIAKPDTSAPSTSEPTAFKAALKKYSINNAKIIYDDASLGFFMELDNFNHSGKGDFTQDLFVLETQSDIEKLTVKYGGIPYLNQVNLAATLPIEMDMKQMKFTLKENEIKLNELLLSFVGSLGMPANGDMVLDFKFDAQKSDLKNFLSLIPAIYAANFKDLQASGKFGMSGWTRGVYNEKTLPAFNINLLVENGKIKYPALPSAINNIQVKTIISNPDGVIDHTEVNVPAFHLEFGNAPIDGRLLVRTPVSDPFVDLALKGKLDLKQMTTIFPMKDMNLSGILNADVKASGRKSSIDKGRYNEFKAAGQMVVSAFNYSGANVPKPVNISSASMTFNPKNISLSNLSAQVGASDFQANGTINNYLAYVFKKGQPLQGTFNVSSKLVNVNELMGPAKVETKNDTSKLTVIEVPANIDFTMTAKAGRVLYDNMDIQNARGALLIKNQTIYFKDMSLNMLDGNVTMNGSYATTDPKKPKVDIDFGIDKMNIQKAFETFNTVKLLAPIAKYTNGSFSTNLKFNTDLNQNMMPVYSSINAEGFTNIIQAIVQGFEPMNKLSMALNTDKLKKLEVSNLLAKFRIEEGRLKVSPFDIKKGDFSMNVQGSNGLDQSMDYKLALNVPRSMLGSQANATVNSLISQFNSKTGTNVSVGETVKVNALLGGSILKPTVKLQLANDNKAAAQSVLAQAVDQKKAEVETRAKEEVTKLKEQATEQVKQKVDTVKKQATEKVKSELKNKLKGFLGGR